jgi:outer membrane lipoprotein-sorting protein
MMRRLGFSVIAAAILAMVPSGGGAQEGRGLSALEAASARYRAATSVCAHFTQTLSVPLLGQENHGSGRLCQEQPDLFAMRFDDPAGDVVVMDGTYVWIYYKSSDPKAVIRLPVADAPGGFDLHREFLVNPAQKYRISYEGTEKVDGRDTDRIRLVPRAPASYQVAVVWIDVGDHLLRRVKLEEENESVRTVTLSDVTFDPRIPEGWFTFTPPSGAQIISR